MLDLETLSSEPDAAIITIGACDFRVDGGSAAYGNNAEADRTRSECARRHADDEEAFHHG